MEICNPSTRPGVQHPNGATTSTIRIIVPLFHSAAVNRLSPASVRFATMSSTSAHSATPTGYSPL
jgi:hypothetical protein